MGDVVTFFRVLSRACRLIVLNEDEANAGETARKAPIAEFIEGTGVDKTPISGFLLGVHVDLFIQMSHLDVDVHSFQSCLCKDMEDERNRVVRKNAAVSFYGLDLNTSKTADLCGASVVL